MHSILYLPPLIYLLDRELKQRVSTNLGIYTHICSTWVHTVLTLLKLQLPVPLHDLRGNHTLNLREEETHKEERRSGEVR